MLEFEQLLKVFFADQGSRADALAAIATIREWAKEKERENIDVAQGYLAGAGPFPERLPVLTLVGKFMTDYIDAIANWAEWAEQVVSQWPQDLTQAEPVWEVLEATARRQPE